MPEELNTTEQFNLILRRFEEPFSPWAFAVPVAAALFVFILVRFQRASQANQGFFAKVFNIINPPWAALVFTGACLAYVLLSMQLLQNLLLGWVLVTAPVVAAALVYVALMYYRDARSVGLAWATMLGLLRCTVYALLAFIFLLPGWQQSSKTERTSKVVVLFDVSGSMYEVDDLPKDGNLKGLLTRQGKILQFLTDKKVAFLANLLKTNPVTCYRFGKIVDPNHKDFVNTEEKEWTKAELTRELRTWLSVDPNRKGIDPKQEQLERDLYSGTNLGGALRQVFEWETANMLQGVILFSDGRSNVEDDKQGSAAGEQVYDEIRDQANKMKIPLICVGVGKFKPPISIRVNDPEAPTTARPDEPFPVQVPVASQGLKGKPYQVLMEARRVKDREDKPIKGEVYQLPVQNSKHTDTEPDRVEFQIDVAKLKGIDPKNDPQGLLQGTWEFHVRVARDKREAFAKAFHTSEQPARVKVLQKQMRVLIFASGPSKEYQFLKTYFRREAEAKRMEVGVFLQTNKNEEIDFNENEAQEWILDHFPELRVRTEVKQKPYVLFEYDLIIALDPDWTQLAPEHLKLIKEWVQEKAGGLVLVAGPVNTYQLREVKEPDAITPIRDVIPVVLQDDRVLGLGEGFNPTDQKVLSFRGALGQYDFLKLDDSKEGPTAGWNEFFYDTDNPKEDSELVYGFYRYYPVRQAKGIAQVVATFPKSKNDSVPYIVTAKSGSGNAVFIGSLELWRLRQHEQKFHLRFWLNMARFAGSGNMGRLQKFGEANVPEHMLVGDKKHVEYRLSGPDGKFLPREAATTKKIMVTVVPYIKGKDDEETPDTDKKNWKSYPLKAKPASRTAEADGWFMAELSMPKEGRYQLVLPIPGTPETLRNTTTVTRPNPEMDNTRPDLIRLYEIASSNQILISRLTDETKKELGRVKGPIEEGGENRARDGTRLYFDLGSAALIPQLMITDKETRETKGTMKDLRDEAGETPWVIGGYTVKVAWVMLAIVVLLSLEWLTRKLLRLA